jgi:DNA-binding GntR family transcriptional regulator
MIVYEESEPQGERNGPQRDQAYCRLRQILILHQAPEGKRLNEETWAKRLEVNRAALREAFARLEAEGLIVKGVMPGYFVPKLDRDDVGEIFEVRIMLEGGAIDRIIRKGLNTAANLAPLKESCVELAENVRKADYVLVAQADRNFHESLVKVSRNRRLSILYQRAPLPILPPDAVSGDEWMARVERTLQEHQSLIELILAGDNAAANAMLRTHLQERFHLPLRVV